MGIAFPALHAPHHHKTWLATCMLQDDAHQQWKSGIRTTFQGQEVHVTEWTEFVEAFNRHYFPKLVYQQKQLEFNNLTQSELPVREYARLFISPKRFAPGGMHKRELQDERLSSQVEEDEIDQVNNLTWVTCHVYVVNSCGGQCNFLKNKRMLQLLIKT